MTKVKTYNSAKDFRTALESRIRTISEKEDIEIPKLRIQVSFDRLLTRLFHDSENPWLLKGGYAMQLRMKNARATKDVDLAMKEMPFLSDSYSKRNLALLELVQKAALLDLNDFFKFKILLPSIELEGAPKGGGRFPVEAYMDDRIFSKFNDEQILKSNNKLIVIDESQKAPPLFDQIKFLVDQDKRPGQFLILGSTKGLEPSTSTLATWRSSQLSL